MAATVKVKEYGVEKYSNGQQRRHHQQTVWRGSALYQSSSPTSKFSFINNIVGVFETEVDDDSSNVIQKAWEWKY